MSHVSSTNLGVKLSAYIIEVSEVADFFAQPDIFADVCTYEVHSLLISELMLKLEFLDSFDFDGC